MLTNKLGTDLSYPDNIALGGPFYAETASEIVPVIEAVAALLNARPSASEAVSVSEATDERLHLTVGLPEGVPLAEYVDFSEQLRLLETVFLDEDVTPIFRLTLEEALSVVLSESATPSVGRDLAVTEAVALIEAERDAQAMRPHVSEIVRLEESLSIGAEPIVSHDGTVEIRFPWAMHLDELLDFENWKITPLRGAFPIGISAITPLTTPIQEGHGAAVVSATNTTTDLALDTAIPPMVGSYLVIFGAYYEVLATGGGLVTVEGVLPPYPYVIPWNEVVVNGVTLTVTRPINHGFYRVDGEHFRTTGGTPVVVSQEFEAAVSKPRLVGAELLLDGQLLLTFSQIMRPDPALTDPAEYRIDGPTAVKVLRVETFGTNQITLYTQGIDSGAYSIVVNALGTPKDFAGNPIDPVWNTAAFTGAAAYSVRSIFTDHGPISKPPLTLQAGATGSIASFTEVALPTAVLNPALVGKYLTLAGSTNSGTYRISAIIPGSPPKVRVQASFTVPDAGPLTWEIFDPRNGQIADDPADVAVTVGGLPVTPEAVLGLLGQVVLPARPAHGSDVKIDYSWVRNPEVEMRRLNAKEFRLNNWNRDNGRPNDVNQHKYRFNNVLTVPASYNADDLQVNLPQPVQRDLKYRAYERAYTALLNDPNLLTLNNPNHRIAFPPLERPVSATFVTYDALALPEASSPSWSRYGAGTATLDNGELVVQDTAAGPFPSGEPVFWERLEDSTFPHVLAMTWRMRITAVPGSEGVFTGVCVGYSGETRALVMGYLEVGGVKQIGILKRGYGNDPSQAAGWTGGVDATLNPTGLPADFDWTVEHSYRLFRALDGTVRIYVDGEVVEILRVLEDELPFLEELAAPFDALEGIWWGSLSRPATNTSRWTFVRYEILPTNPKQIEPSIYVSYEGTTAPEDASQPWTPIGYHGTETIVGGNLVLDSTSATDAATESTVGLVGGDFKGFMKLEPLLGASSENVLDVNVQLRTWTHGITNNAVTAAIDDGDRLIQLCFFPDKAAPKLSYGGRSFPDEWTPLPWTKTVVQNATAAMLGRTLRITNPDVTSGLVYSIDDTPPEGSDARVAAFTTEYVLECRLQVQSYTPDPAGYCGAQATAFDGTRAVGLLLLELGGSRFVAFHADGNVVGTPMAFDWFDGQPHTFRVTKRFDPGMGVTLVSLFVDTVYLGALDYTFFAPLPPPDVAGQISFGSATPASTMAISTVDWLYCNAWRVLASVQKFVGIWNGKETDSLLGYHLPLQATGTGTTGNINMGVEPLPASVMPGDKIVIDEGLNRGVYEIVTITAPRTGVHVHPDFPASGAIVSYRIPKEIDWTTAHKYRVIKQPGDMVQVLLDSDPTPILAFSYDQLQLPARSKGIFMGIANALPGVSFGAFDPTNLSQAVWDYVRFGITRSPTEMRLCAHHEILNQRNVMASYEHVKTNIPHPHTDYWSSSTGIPPQTEPDFQRNPAQVAFTLLNAGTPLFPRTQTAEARTNSVPLPLGLLTVTSNTDGSRIRLIPPPEPPLPPAPPLGRLLVGPIPTPFGLFPVPDFAGPPPTPGVVQIDPHGELRWDAGDLLAHLGEQVFYQQQYEGDLYPLQVPVSGLNRPEDVLNSDPDFVLNDGAFRWSLHVPDDVLYNSLQVIETVAGSEPIYPFDDQCPDLGTIFYQDRVCLRYTGDVLPELDTSSAVRWEFEAGDDTHVQRSIFNSVLTFGTDPVGTWAIYRNPTPLPDAPALQTEARFRLRLAADSSGGLGDTQVRFGMSAPGYTLALAFVTTPLGQRYVLVRDLNAGTVVGGMPFDFSDGLFHTYRIVRDIGSASVQVFIDP